MALLGELKRRNVFRVAAAYAVIGWLLAQVADVAFDAFGAPDWVPKSVLFLLLLGFPVAILFAWAFEMTPEGIKREKDVDRSQSITDHTGQKLNRVIITVLIAAVALLLVDKFVLRDVPAPDVAPVAAVGNTAAEEDKSVAVLPFVAMSSGPDDEYFADGLTEEILNSLAQLPELLVTARTSAFSFKGQDLPIPEIAAALGVAHIVEGSVRRAGERLRITAQLIRASDGFHLWSETYERSAADSFGVQDEIAEKIAVALDVVLDEEQLARMRSTGMRNPEAFIAHQKGVERFAEAHAGDGNGQLDILAEANVFFEAALELEPNAAWAHFDSADYYVHFVMNRGYDGDATEAEMDEALAEAKRRFQKAIDTSATDADRLGAALELALISGQWRRLPELFQAAVESPDCMMPSFWGAIGPFTSSLDGVLGLWEKANVCDPLNFYPWANLPAIQLRRGDAELAFETAIRGLAAVPHEQVANAAVRAKISLGQFDEALAVSERYIETASERLRMRVAVATARGDEAEARRLMDKLSDDMTYAAGWMVVQARIGDRDEANRLAAETDTNPLGVLALLDAADFCYCGAPFDLDATPNFARLIEEANLEWPPQSTINWPLKDW